MQSLRRLIYWLHGRPWPSPRGYPLIRAYYCTICHEVSDGRQNKCVREHTHKIVHLFSLLHLHQHRIEELFNKLTAARRELKDLKKEQPEGVSSPPAAKKPLRLFIMKGAVRPVA